jgi:simple sugar transport system ATP-binding protein
MGFQRNKQFSQYSVLSRSQITKHARHLISKFGVKIENEKVKVGTLSGGNLQKIVVAREIAKEGVLLIAEQPTRGVDVGAIENIHAQLLAESAKGRAVLLVSSELSELLALCDRIIVMFEGRALAIVERSAATETNLGYLMAGKVVA